MDPNATPEVEIRSSARRRKTGVAFWEAGHVVVVVPERMSRTTRENFADQLVNQLLQRTRPMPGSPRVPGLWRISTSAASGHRRSDGPRANSGAGVPARCTRGRSGSHPASKPSPSGCWTA
jgi:hypothetical protein